MSKKPKQKQTEWNIQGKQIADTAVPYYQQNLGRINDYLANPQGSMDDYLSKYYDNTAAQSDFLRNYNRAMGGATGQNVAASGGGFSSANQRNYDDLQRYQNDLASRLRDYGVTSAYNMAAGDYRNMLAANDAYRAAYGLGQPYSDTDQYNYMVGQTNKWYNQLGGLLGTAGAAVGNLINPVVGATIGAGIGNTLGDAMTVRFDGSPTTAGQYANQATDALVKYYEQKGNLDDSRLGREERAAGQGLGQNAAQAFVNNLNGLNIPVGQSQTLADAIGYNPFARFTTGSLNPYNSVYTGWNR